MDHNSTQVVNESIMLFEDGCPVFGFFFFKQKTAYEIQYGLVGSETLIDSESINALSDSDNDVDTDAEARLESPLLNDAEVLSDTCLSCNALAESDDDFEVDADVLLETSPLIDAESLNDAFSEAN